MKNRQFETITIHMSDGKVTTFNREETFILAEFAQDPKALIRLLEYFTFLHGKQGGAK